MMYFVADVIKDPLKHIDDRFQSHFDNGCEQCNSQNDKENQEIYSSIQPCAVETVFFEFKNIVEEHISKIPSLNACHNLQCTAHHHHHKLVHMRGMIQDQFEPEYFATLSKLRSAGAEFVRSNYFRDTVTTRPNEEVLQHCITGPGDAGERHIYLCVPIPGETTWTQIEYSKRYSANHNLSSRTEPAKRGADDASGDSTSAKRGKLEKDASAAPQPPQQQNDVVPGSCLLKVYVPHLQQSLKLNDVVDIIGILSVDSFTDEDSDNFPEFNPPGLSVPRLHALSLERPTHTNPVMTADVRVDWTAARAAALDVLNRLLLGDTLAAEFLLLHLLSNVRNRVAVDLPVGHLPLNLSHLPSAAAGHQLPYKVGQVLNTLLTKVVEIPITLEVLNSGQLLSVKDYDTGRLRPGRLQMTAGSELVVDETALTNGQLDTRGVLSIQALRQLAHCQTIPYDFQFHRTDFETNIRLLVVSEGRSLIKETLEVPLMASGFTEPAAAEELFNSLINSLNASQEVTLLREYFTAAACFQCVVEECVQEKVQHDFVAARQREPSNWSGDDLSTLLTLARLTSQSLGEQQLSVSTWEHVLDMDRQRRQRLPK